MGLDVSTSDQQAVDALISRLSDGKPLPLDPADEADQAAIRFFLTLANKTPDRYPGLHSTLNGSPAGGTASTAHVVDLGRDQSGRATSQTWVGTPGLPLMSGATTLLLDSESRKPLAVGTATVLGEGLTRVATDPGTAAPAAPRQTALTLFHSVAEDGTASFGAVSASAVTTDGPVPVITDPVISVSGHTSIVIGLNRPKGGNPDCDYNFLEDAPVSAPPLLVPFTGRITLPFNITGIGEDGQIAGLTVNSVVYVQLSAGQPSLPLLPDSLPEGCTSSAGSPNVLEWSFPYQDPQEPIVYAAAANAVDAQSAFMFQFTVPVDDPSSPYVFAICSTGTPGQPGVHCTPIPNLQFTWHCVAEGTLVTLADGSTVRIEDTHNQMRVRTGTGGDLAVEANWCGQHEGPILTIATDTGRKLTLTPDHPVCAASGLVAARDLKAGDLVVVEGHSIETIASIDTSESSGLFWNLMLGNEDDRKAGASLSVSTFIANGIVVGDFESQGTQYRLRRRDLDYMKPRIPEALHADYASAIADAA